MEPEYSFASLAKIKLANIFRNTSQQHLAKNFPGENFPLYGISMKQVRLNWLYTVIPMREVIQNDCSCIALILTLNLGKNKRIGGHELADSLNIWFCLHVLLLLYDII